MGDKTNFVTIPSDSRLFRLLGDWLTAYEDRTQQWSQSDNSQVLEAINKLDRKVDEFMATQEERLRGVQEGLNAIAEGINKLQQQVADLKTNNPELEDEIGGIEATVKQIADDITGVVPPAPEG